MKVTDGLIYSEDYKTVKGVKRGFCASIVRIPNGVEEIGDNAFAELKTIERVILPRSIRKIGNHAFFQCSLKHINLPKRLEWIGDNCFHCCRSLTGIKLPKSLRSIGKLAFCFTTIEEISIPDGVTDISESAFSLCDKLKSVKLPQNLKKVGKNAFWGTDIHEIVIPDSVEAIGAYAFCCKKLAKVKLPSSLSQLDVNAFDSRTVIKAPCIYSKLTVCSNWKHGYLSRLNIPIEELIVDDTIVCVDEHALHNCQSLRCIMFKGSIEYIGVGAFMGCHTLVSVRFNADVEHVSDNVFAGCANLRSVTFKGCCQSIAKGAFCGCVSLESINIPGETLIRGAFDGKNSWRNRYVDLGLPSGTVWTRRGMGVRMGVSNTYMMAYNPCIEQVVELLDYCEWQDYGWLQVGTSLINEERIILFKSDLDEYCRDAV